MRQLFLGCSLLVCAALVCSTLPADEKKTDKTTDSTDQQTEPRTEKKDKTTAKKSKEKKEKFDYGLKFDGKVTKVEGSSMNFTVQVPYSYNDPQRVAENQTHYTRRMLEIGRERNPQSRAQQLADLQMDMQRRAANAVVNKTKDVDLEANDKTKVRIQNPPAEFDDKGKAKKLSKAELKKLKGPDSTLPGYTAEFEQLRVGQLVTIYLPKQKKEKTKAKGEDVDMPPERPHPVLILIVADPPSQ
jgi:hypothetical protein